MTRGIIRRNSDCRFNVPGRNTLCPVFYCDIFSIHFIFKYANHIRKVISVLSFALLNRLKETFFFSVPIGHTNNGNSVPRNRTGFHGHSLIIPLTMSIHYLCPERGRII